MNDALEATSEGVLLVDRDWRIESANDAAAASVGIDRSALEGADLRAAFPESVGPGFSRFEDDEFPEESVAFEEYYPTRERWLAVRAVPIDRGLAVFVDDVSERRKRADALAARERELNTLDQINRIVGTLVGTIASETDRGQIEETVCDRLAASPLFTLAWIAEPAPGKDILRARASAGRTDGVLEELAGRSASPRGLEAVAAAENAITATQQVADEESVPMSVRRAAFASGIQSAIAVPIAYGDTIYGVLGVYAGRAEAFGSRERTGFATLGETIGVAINAAKQRRLLLSDTVTELTLETGAVADPLAETAAAADAELVGAGIVPVADAALVAFCVVQDGDPEEVCSIAREHDAIGEVRRIGDGDDEALVSVRIDGRSPLSTLVAHGGTVRELHYDRGAGRIVSDVPPADVSAVVDAVTDPYPETTVLAKRERDRDVETAGEFRTAVRDRLTDRQREAVMTAYMGGYYDWPRESTAEDVASTLDVSSPTLHYHLRAAHRKLIDVFLDGATRHSGRTRRPAEASR